MAIISNYKINMMKNRQIKTVAILFVMVFLGSISLNAQQTAFEMATRMSRGINLGNTLDAENYEGGWAPVASVENFDAIKEAGFTTVRIPITWGAALSKDDATPRLDTVKPYKINETFLARVDEIVKWSLDRGLVTVINIHHDHWLKRTSTFDANKERFYNLWKQLSKHYKDYPQELLFEIVNEPHHETNGVNDQLTQEQLESLNKEVLAIVRKNNPTRVTIYAGCGWSSLWDLKKTAVPDSTDKYLMGTYHSYSPWPYAGEGNGSWGTDEDKKSMESEFTQLMEYSKANNVPVFIGEFGAQHKCEYNSRMKHFAYYMENIQKYKVAATAWDDGGYLFKVLDKKTNVWDDSKDILVNYTPNSPDGLKLDIADGNFVNVKWKNRAEGIEKITVERRVGRIGNFEALETIEVGEKYSDETPKVDQTYYYYRVVNELKGGENLISYPQMIYIP